jgi:hypothetical protein
MRRLLSPPGVVEPKNQFASCDCAVSVFDAFAPLDAADGFDFDGFDDDPEAFVAAADAAGFLRVVVALARDEPSSSCESEPGKQ